jgi:hypothetical protein
MVKRIAVLLIANLALGVLFAALTVAFRDNVIDYQLARGSDQTREQLELTVWIRSGIVVVLAAWYGWIARRMVRGRRGAYLRVRSLAVLGVVAVGYLLISGAYPSWMRVLQAAQLTLLVVLVVATNLRPVRESFPRRPRPARPPGNRKAALVLVVLTPVIAEVLLGNVSVAMAWVVLLYIPIYGAGALLIRELVRRAGGGWPSLVAMGIAYGLLEEGLALQSLTSPTLYGAAGWSPRVFGINTAYTELNLPYHVVFSVLIPIALVELLFPGHGTRPYLRTPGIVATAVVTLLGAALLRLAVPTSIDPGYTIPLPAALTILGLETVLVVLALRVLPGLQPWRPAPVRPPAPGPGRGGHRSRRRRVHGPAVPVRRGDPAGLHPRTVGPCPDGRGGTARTRRRAAVAALERPRVLDGAPPVGRPGWCRARPQRVRLGRERDHAERPDSGRPADRGDGRALRRRESTSPGATDPPLSPWIGYGSPCPARGGRAMLAS